MKARQKRIYQNGGDTQVRMAAECVPPDVRREKQLDNIKRRWGGDDDNTMTTPSAHRGNTNKIPALQLLEMDERLLISGAELAAALSLSKKWVDKHAHKIAGSQKVGGRRRFNLEIIKKRLALGKDIII